MGTVPEKEHVSGDNFRVEEFSGTKLETEAGIGCGDPASGIHRKSMRSPVQLRSVRHIKLK